MNTLVRLYQAEAPFEKPTDNPGHSKSLDGVDECYGDPFTNCEHSCPVLQRLRLGTSVGC